MTSDLEQGETADGQGPGQSFRWSEVGAFGRPVVNVTVSLSTLLGVDDDPGLAERPDSTWYGLLNDEAGRFVELSTSAYQPTAAIWRTDVARDRTCVWPGCCRPSVVCDIDHRIPWPIGETSTSNTWPLCPRNSQQRRADAAREPV